MYGVRLIEALPRWLYRFQPVFFCMALFGVPLCMTGFGDFFLAIFMVLYFVPGQALFWLLSWLAARCSTDKRLGFSTIPFSVYLLTTLFFYFTTPIYGPQFDETPSVAMRLASVVGLQLTDAVSDDLAGVFLKVMLVSGALALLAALIDIARALDRASRAEQPPQRGGKNEQAEAETAPTPTGAAPQEPPACG